MKLIVCVDKNNGMMFNNRRQSRDIEVIKDILGNIDGSLWIGQYSKELFVDYFEKNNITFEQLDNNIINASIDGKKFEIVVDEKRGVEYYFIERNVNDLLMELDNETVKDYTNNIDEIILYNWNKVYPADVQFEVDLSQYSKVESVEFKGNSHDVITKYVYSK
ncbi:MAG: hypothetical protein E7262_05500 [Lachnospiraceae bacterium]|nr:hypothetical protein [Lachnospiraceae bacterium]